MFLSLRTQVPIWVILKEVQGSEVQAPWGGHSRDRGWDVQSAKKWVMGPTSCRTRWGVQSHSTAEFQPGTKGGPGDRRVWVGSKSLGTAFQDLGGKGRCPQTWDWHVHLGNRGRAYCLRLLLVLVGSSSIEQSFIPPIFTECPHLIQMVPNLGSFNLWFFYFTVVWKWNTFSRNCTTHFEFCSFPGVGAVQYSALLCFWAMVWATAPRQPRHPRGKQLIHSEPFCTRTTTLVFTFSEIIHITNHRR